MDADKLYDDLLLAQNRDEYLVVTFDDGDKYQLSNIDLCFSSTFDGSRENEPLLVKFENCLNEPSKKLKAYQNGRLRTAGVIWTSIEPVAPVGMVYEIENVVAIWDDTKSYFLFDRGTLNV